jgi:hypothetical protein
MTEADEPDPARVMPLIRAVSTMLAGEHPVVQGATLADLLASWLAGHRVTPEVRAELLAAHIELVISLIPLNDEAIRERIKSMSSERAGHG